VVCSEDMVARLTDRHSAVQEYVVVTMGTEGICVKTLELSCSGVQASCIPGCSLSVPWPRRPVAGVTLRRPDPVTLGRGFLRILLFSPASIIPPVLIVSLILLL